MRAPRRRRGPAASRGPTIDEKSLPQPEPRTYEQKLIAALKGPLPDRRILAARILGRLRSWAAIDTLEAIAREAEDPYLAAEAAHALASIDPELPAVAELARSGSRLTRSAVESAAGRRGSPALPAAAPKKAEGGDR
jgi:hypothetical protein